MSLLTLTKTVITMGDGDLLTGMVSYKGGIGAYTFMRAAKKGIPGTKVPELDDKFGIEAADVAIVFPGLAMVDQVIADLTLLRDKMKAEGAK